jgi:hypothetical protein
VSVVCGGYATWLGSVQPSRDENKKHQKAGAPVGDDLVQRYFTADGLDRVWLTDITEHWTTLDSSSRRNGRGQEASSKAASRSAGVSQSSDFLGLSLSSSATACRSSTACYASTSPKAPTYPAGRPRRSKQSLTHSTQDPERPSDGRPPPRRSTSNYCYTNKPVLHPLVEPGQFRSRKFQHALKRHDLLGSGRRVGACGDNAAMESFSVCSKRTCWTGNAGKPEMSYASRSWSGSKRNTTANANNDASENSPQSSSRLQSKPQPT